MLQINAAEAEKVRLKQQLLISTSKSTYGGSGFGFEMREIPDLVFSPVAKKSPKHRKAPRTETANSQQSTIPAIDQKFIDLFGKDLPPVVDDGDDHDVRQRQHLFDRYEHISCGVRRCSQRYLALSSHGVMDFVERSIVRPSNSGPPRALWFPRESERITETASVYSAFSRSVSPPRTATIKQPLVPKASMIDHTRRAQTSWERKRPHLRGNAPSSSHHHHLRPGTSALTRTSGPRLLASAAAR
jgi:hypothetical protein